MAVVIDPGQVRTMARAAYANVDALGEPIVIHKRNGASMTQFGPINAFVRSYRREELIPGGPIEQGDFLATVNRASWPAGLGVLARGDRVTWRGQLYAVMLQDDASRSVAGEQFGVDLQLRGGAI